MGALEGDLMVGSRGAVVRAEAQVEALTAVPVTVAAVTGLVAEVAVVAAQAVDVKPLAEHQGPMASEAFLRERVLCDPLSQGPQSPI